MMKSVLAMLLVAGLVGCRSEEVAEDTVAVPNVSPAAIAELSGSIEEATIDVASGRFRITELFVQEDEPTVLHVANADAEPYRLRIEELVAVTVIAADATTDVMFTTPDAGVLTGQLLEAEGDEVLDTFIVTVLGPGGVEP